MKNWFYLVLLFPIAIVSAACNQVSYVPPSQEASQIDPGGALPESTPLPPASPGTTPEPSPGSTPVPPSSPTPTPTPPTSPGVHTVTFVPTYDTAVNQRFPTARFGSDTAMRIDVDAGASGDQVSLGLLYFSVQLPANVTIVSANLGIQVVNSGDSAAFYRVLSSWNENSTWSSFGTGGLRPDGISMETTPLFTTTAFTRGQWTFDVKSVVQLWASGTPNYGFAIASQDTNGFDIATRESGTPPTLSVTYQVP